MPGDPPGADSKGDREVCVVCGCVECCRSLGWFMLGRCQVSEISWRICGSSHRKVSV